MYSTKDGLLMALELLQVCWSERFLGSTGSFLALSVHCFAPGRGLHQKLADMSLR